VYVIITRSSATAERQRVSYERLSRLAHWSCTSLNTATVVQLYNKLAKLVSTLSANKPCDVRGRWSFQTLHTFKLICFCIIRKPLRAFINNTYSKWPHISKISERWWCIMWIITKFRGSTPVRGPLINKPRKKSYKHHMHLKSQFIGLIFVADR